MIVQYWDREGRAIREFRVLNGSIETAAPSASTEAQQSTGGAGKCRHVETSSARKVDFARFLSESAEAVAVLCDYWLASKHEWEGTEIHTQVLALRYAATEEMEKQL